MIETSLQAFLVAKITTEAAPNHMNTLLCAKITAKSLPSSLLVLCGPQIGPKMTPRGVQNGPPGAPKHPQKPSRRPSEPAQRARMAWGASHTARAERNTPPAGALWRLPQPPPLAPSLSQRPYFPSFIPFPLTQAPWHPGVNPRGRRTDGPAATCADPEKRNPNGKNHLKRNRGKMLLAVL